MIAKCGGNKKFRENYYLIRAGNQVPFIRNTVVDKKQIFALNDTMISKKYLSPEKTSNIPGQIYADVVKEISTDSNPTIRTINTEKFIELNTEWSIEWKEILLQLSFLNAFNSGTVSG